MELLLIRHGQTAGNLEKRYIGKTDEPLCDMGREILRHKREAGVFGRDPELVFTSPLLRCVQTAQILFPDAERILIPELAEMDFGIFENRAYKGDLENSPEYSEWLESLCEAPVPGGESKQQFTERCRRGFDAAICILDERKAKGCPVEKAAFVVHGGTVMSILSGRAREKKTYYEWNPENAGGYACEWDNEQLVRIRNL
ncbi:MAG: histidine phosphatase family protein [Parasporobacterium sp.]|nr:histidine phosphatase family protein [Parasporobacterium sp.]